MELSHIVRRLLVHKAGLAAVFAVAVLLALMIGYKVTSSGLSSRATSSGAATTQILIDAPQSALANLKQNTIPLTTRAGIFAQFMASTAVREAVAGAADLPASEIVARGPFDDPDAAPAGITTAGAGEGDAEPPAYVLTFVAQAELPLVTVYAQAPDAQSAARLAAGVAPGVQDYVDELQAQGELLEKDRVTIRGLGEPTGSTIAGGAAGPKMIAVFIVVSLLGCLVLLSVTRRDPRHQDWAPPEPFEDEPLPVNGAGVDAAFEDDPWPAPKPVKSSR